MCMTKALGVEGIRIGQITSAHVTCEVICITSGTLKIQTYSLLLCLLQQWVVIMTMGFLS